MGLSDAGANNTLEEVFNAGAGTFPTTNGYVSLHSGLPGATGANELTNSGGSTYARQQVDFSAAAARTLSNVAAITFSNLPTVNAPGILGWGLWDAASAGTCYFTGLASTIAKLFVVRAADLASNDFQSPAHNFNGNDYVALEAVEDVGLPTGVNQTTVYQISTVATDSFVLSGVDVTAVGAGLARLLVPKVVVLGENLTIGAGELDVFL